MIEKVNPSHPDKVADRIAGAIVDLAYTKQDNPKIAVEVLIGHGNCHIITETSVKLREDEIIDIVARITGDPQINVDYQEEAQDPELAKNQAEEIRCGDNGIFKGMPSNREELDLADLVDRLYEKWPTDGKFIYNEDARTVIACQSNARSHEVEQEIDAYFNDLNLIIVNPLGEWTGGTNVDTGATNRKLGSDMGRAVTGGGLHGKDLSKADVSVNIVCHLLAEKNGKEVNAFCAIGDTDIKFDFGNNFMTLPYSEVIEMAHKYINGLGGFEKLAEWGLI